MVRSQPHFVRGWAEEIDGEWVHEIRLVQAALESTSAWPRKLPPEPTIETIQDGGFDNSGQFPSPEVQRLHMPPEFLGTYQLRRSDNLARTVILDREDDPETTVRDAIRAIFGGETGITVRLYENYADITFAGALNGENIAELEVVPGEAPPGDPTILLDFRRGAVSRALRATATATVFFEIKGYIAADDADPEDAGLPEVLFRREVTLVRGQNWDGAETAQEPAWLRPREPENYTPTTPDQIQTGISYWTGVKGNGVSTSIPCDHNLASQEVASLTVLDNGTGEVRPPTSWAVTSDNTITLEYDEAPTENSLKVIIAMAVPVSQWDPHTHTQDQIEDLVEDLEELFSRVSTLEAVLPSTGPGVTAGSTAAATIMLPKISEILFIEPGDYLGENSGIDPSKLPSRAPYMFPAVHFAEPAALPIPLPSPADNAGTVWQNQTGGPVLIVPGGKNPAKYVPDDGYVASDGRGLYVVLRDGATNSYYPAACDRTLFTLGIGEKQLIVGRTLQIDFTAQLQLARAMRNEDQFCLAQWVMRMELGAYPADTTPTPIGLNLKNVVWSTTPVYAEPILIDPLFRSYAFGIRIQRLAGGINLDQQIFGNWTGNNAAAPAAANFVVRARLTQFDTENSQSQARAFVYYGLSGGLDDEGKLKAEPARAVIF